MPTYDAGDARLRIVPDAREFRVKLEADLKRIQADYAVNVTANTAQAAADIRRFRDVEARNDLRVGVDAALGQAQADLARFRALQQADRITIPVDVDRNSIQRARHQVTSAFEGIGGDLFSAVKWNAGAGAISLLPTMATGLAGVTSALQELSQSSLVLPGIMAAAGASIGTVMLGAHGLKDAFKELGKQDGTQKQLDKLNAVLADLSPNARAFVTAVAAIKPAFADLQNTVQNNLFAGIGDQLKTLADRDLPNLKTGLGGIATALNHDFTEVMRVLGTDGSRGLLDRILGNTSQSQERFTAAIQPLLNGLLTLSAAGTDVLPRLADGFGKAATRFDRFITEADQDGRLDKWINDGIDGLDHLGNTFINLGKIIGAITTAMGGGDGLLSMLERGTDRLQAFLNSGQGQDMLRNLFERGREELDKWKPLLETLPGLLSGVMDASSQWMDVILPPLTTVSKLLSDHPGLVEAVATAFLAWKTLSFAGGILGQLSSISGALGSKGGGGLLGKIGAVAAALAAIKIGNDLINPDDKTTPPPSAAQKLGGAALDIAGGAYAGFRVAGPLGAAAGAGLGAATATAESVKGDLERQQAQSRKNWEQQQKGYQPPTVDESRYGPPIDAVVQRVEAAAAAVDALGIKISMLPNGDIKINDPTPAIIDQVEKLGLKVQTLPNGTVTIQADTASAMGKIGALQGAVNDILGSIGAIPATIPRPQYGPGAGSAGSVGAIPRYNTGGPTRSGRGDGPTGGWISELHSDEWVVNARGRANLGDDYLAAVNAGHIPSFDLGGFIGHLGNGMLPGPATSAGAVGGTGPQDFAHQWFPWLAGFEKTGDPFANAPAKIQPQNIAYQFGQTLLGGVLGGLGLDKSFLSPTNPYNQAAQQTAGFYFNKFGGGATSSGAAALSDADVSAKLAEAGFNPDQINAVITSRDATAQRDALQRQLANLGLSSTDIQAAMKAKGGNGKAPAANYSGGSDSVHNTVYNAFKSAGFPDSQWPAMVNLINGESGWNPKAKNPSSTAYGLGQFLDSTWTEYGGRKTSNAAEQARLIMSYIAGRYGDPAKAWAFWQAQDPHWYSTGGTTPGSESTPIPAVLHGGEFVQRARAVTKYGVPFMTALNQGIIDPKDLPHFALGGSVVDVMRGMVEPPRPAEPKLTPLAAKNPQPAGPAKQFEALRPPTTTKGPSQPAQPKPAPQSHEGSGQAPGPEQAPSQQKDKQKPATAPKVSAAPSSYDHELPALKTAVTSAAATAGSLAQSAIGAAPFPGAGQAGAMVAGLIKQGGKIANDVINVPSSFLVGNITPGTQDSAYGTTLTSPAQQASNAPVRITNYGGFYGHSTDDVLQQLDLRTAQDQQAALAAHPR